jgi:hypothetical protein
MIRHKKLVIVRNYYTGLDGVFHQDICYSRDRMLSIEKQ